MKPVEISRGDGPLVLSIPHAGTHVPMDIHARLTPVGRRLPDTDWWIDRVYDFATILGATVVRSNISRYVIDLNRDPAGHSLYPGQATTALCPTITFDGDPLYVAGEEPDAAEIDIRRRNWFDPYHAALATEIERARAHHGVALLYDCHSIRSHVPRLFEGELPELNVGTNVGTSCSPELEAAVVSACAARGNFSHILNGRFRGGWITRHYANPGAGVHAIQMELAQRTYMEEEPPWTFDELRAEAIRPVLRDVLKAMLDWGRREEP